MTALKVAKSCRQFLQPKYQPLVIQTATSVNLFDVDKKSGYHDDLDGKKKKGFIESLKLQKGEFKLFTEEIKDKLRLRHLDRWNLDHGTYEYLWKFGGKESVERWTLTADRDNLEGQSSVNLSISKDNNALFHGYLSQQVPKDGISKNAGYCNMKSPSNYISFKRKRPIDDIGIYSHLVLRVRGDGRPYYINLQMKRAYDIMWSDQFNYTLYTRGGPYWQVAKIPFSKFFFTHKGRNQDHQYPPDLQNIENIGITMADGVEGPFQLEIDYIAVLNDANHLEETAYEDYNYTF
ncbi:complex I intermediate-associated protein 30, mitochondrial-like [Ylistrum balloti]|uniref:complex I intermediate-associated protein 30, mitochondrial-like n=1 Tax=Ylistrum balloti TaxID=509963 RepID=UPI002905BC2F|nr:complex I intermediate-associated protein 30, mitochondrial-like [Ylistrum balloti]XP_060082976.1 complex I intermediate-associated protein 30, mitochondrial-like [Ylistrum balloti]